MNTDEIVCEGGLPRKAWNRVMNAYLCGTGIPISEPDGLSFPQQIILDEIKKTFNRLSYEESKQETA